MSDLPSIFDCFLSATNLRVILRPDDNPDAWDSWGVRDPANLELTPSFNNSQDQLCTKSIYYTGSSCKGSIQQTGLITSTDDGQTWTKCASNPILSVTPNSWDSSVASTSWVINYNSKYYMYYRGSTKPCRDDAVGLAVSDNGIDFVKYTCNPILKSSDFAGVRQQPSTLGVLNAIIDKDNTVIILFEACENENNQKGQIFGARSDDGVNFKPLNDGFPVFSANNITSWPVTGVCNPRLHLTDNNGYILSFNGNYNGEYAIGLAFSNDLRTWTEHKSNPVLIPTGAPLFSDYTYRLEGLCIANINETEQNSLGKCYLMAIPAGAQNHQGSIISHVDLIKHHELKHTLNTRTLSVNPQSIHVDANTISFNPCLEPSKYASVLFFEKNITNISFSLSSQTNSELTTTYLVLSNCIPILSMQKYNIAFKIVGSKVLYRTSTANNIKSNSLLSRTFRFMRRRVSLIFDNLLILTGSPRRTSTENWIQLSTLQKPPKTINLKLTGTTNGTSSIILQINNQSSIINEIPHFQAEVLCLSSEGAPSFIRDLVLRHD